MSPTIIPHALKEELLQLLPLIYHEEEPWPEPPTRPRNATPPRRPLRHHWVIICRGRRPLAAEDPATEDSRDWIQPTHGASYCSTAATTSYRLADRGERCARRDQQGVPVRMLYRVAGHSPHHHPAHRPHLGHGEFYAGKLPQGSHA